MFYLDLFRTLEEEGVRYLVVGGLALNIHGVERATMDVDLMVALDPDNTAAFLRAARRLALVPALPVPLEDLADAAKVRDWVENRHMLAFALRPPAASAPTVDVLVRPSVAFSDAWQRRLDKDLGVTHVQVAAVEDLIALKTGTGRMRDQSDIEALQRLRRLGLP